MNRVLPEDKVQWAQLKEVYRLRVEVQELRDQEAEQESICQLNPDYQAWQQSRNTRALRAKELEAQEKKLREISAKLAEEGAEDIPGVIIMHGTVYEYDQKAAILWAFERGILNLVAIKDNDFEKMIPVVGDTIDFVTTKKVTKANLKSELYEDITYYGGLE